MSGLHVGVFAYAEEPEALLRPRSSPLHDVQLLSEIAAAGNHSCAELVRSRSGEDSRAVRVPAGRICCYAGPCASADERAVEGYAIVGVEGIEATGFAGPGKKKRRARTGQLPFAFMKEGERLPRFWQPRFYDFNVYSAKKKREKLEYMHANPVKRELVKHPGAWIWSSYLFYEKREVGLVEIDTVD